MTWNDIAPIYLVALLSLLLVAVIGTLWLLARRMLWATVRVFTVPSRPFTIFLRRVLE